MLSDTMVAARLAGERSFGLAALLEKYFRVRLDKRHQRADWSMRPLTPEMERYAALDTRYLEALADLLERRLLQLNRTEWAAEEFRRVAQVRWGAERGPEQTLARMKGVHALDRRELAVAMQLVVLRDEVARRNDLPLFRVMRDEQLLDMAAGQPRSIADLRAVRRLASSWKSGSNGRDLLAAVERGRSLPDDVLPPLPARSSKRRAPELEARIKQLCRERDRLAEGLDLEPSVLASRAVLEAALVATDGGQPISSVDALRKWQSRLLAPLFEG